MKQLNPLWFTQEPIDLEHKQYIILDYLQDVEREMTSMRMYPAVQDIFGHINTINTYRDNRNAIYERLRSIKNINPETMQFEYTYPDINQEFVEVDSILGFAEPRLRHAMTKATSICIDIMAEMKWYSVGIIPTYTDEGFVTIIAGDRQTCYRYGVTRLIVSEENLIAVNLEFVTERESSVQMIDELKAELAKSSDLPVPMMLAVETKPYPTQETIVPLIKRLIPQKIREIAGTRYLP